jgi:hypothetical protein
MNAPLRCFRSSPSRAPDTAEGIAGGKLAKRGAEARAVQALAYRLGAVFAHDLGKQLQSAFRNVAHAIMSSRRMTRG